MPADPLNDAIATLAELRALDPLGDEARYPDDVVLGARDGVIDALEGECNVSFVRRVKTDAFADRIPLAQVALKWGGSSRRHPGPVISACTVNDVVLDAGALADLRVGDGGLVSRLYGGFGCEASVTYEQGYAVCPGRVRRAVKMLTRDWVVEELDDALPSRATSWTAGENTYRLVTAGVAGAVFDLPEANAVVKRFRE